jgi:hypothetical protein
MGQTPTKVKVLLDNHSSETFTYKYVFLNSDKGWRLISEPLGMHQQNSYLYRTADGGSTWDKITATNDDEYSIPHTTISGIIFIDDKTGWITTETPQEGNIGLYKTTDGGYIWEGQKPEIPKEHSRSQFRTFAPVFFSSEDGLLFTYQYNAEDQLVFATHDDGGSWTQASKEDDDIKWDCETGNDGDFAGWKVTYNDTIWETKDAICWNELPAENSLPENSDLEVEISGLKMILAGEKDNSISDEDELLLQTNAIALIAGISEENDAAINQLGTAEFKDQLSELLSHKDKDIRGKEISMYSISHAAIEDDRFVVYIWFCCLEIKDDGFYAYVYFNSDKKINELLFET